MKKIQNSSVSRRRFIKDVSCLTIATPFISSIPSILKAKGERKINHVCVGVGGMGWHDLQNFISHPQVNIVAICDVDRSHLRKAHELVPDAEIYTDWRELLNRERNNFESMNVTVPDHTHFSVAYSGLSEGKHVYCQKPLCHDVEEIRKLTKKAEEVGVVTQLGTQVASSEGDQLGEYLIKSGVIGKIKHVYLCSNRPGAIETYRLKGPRPEKGIEPPNSLRWDLWLGSAPERSYSPDIYHPTLWRAWQDFGTGWSGDIGCHIFSAVWKGLDLKYPLQVKSNVQKSWEKDSNRFSETWPQSDHITWIFEGNHLTKSNKLKVEWFDGLFYPPQKIRDLYKGEYPPESAMLIGTEGALLIPHGGIPKLLPEGKFSSVDMPSFKEENHYHNFIDACVENIKDTRSKFSITGPMSETVILGTIAIRNPNTNLKWDSKKLKFISNPNANALLRRNYRKGWNLGGF